MPLEVYYKFVLAFGLILVAARVGGEIADRYLNQPPVIGELIIGILIGPFAIGSLIHDPIILNLATVKGGAFGIENFNIMEIISEISVVALLFVAGVETNVKAFMRHGLTGASVAVGGATLPFIFGCIVAMLFVPGIGIEGWLFMGAVLMATSIGLTVRILSDMGKLHSKEGVTILVAAVIDDIIGIVVLSVVVSIAAGGGVNLVHVLMVAAAGFGMWYALLMFGIKGDKYISKYFLGPFKRSGTAPIFAIIAGFLIAYIVTLAELHPVVGAYVAGLMFAATKERESIIETTRPIMLFLAPFFFTYLGMQVNFFAIQTVVFLSIVLIVVAIVGKIIGGYIPARLVGPHDHRGAMAVGIGLIPRGEVGLIIAGVGLLSGAISRPLFGAAVGVSIITSLITPTMLKPYFKLENAMTDKKKRAEITVQGIVQWVRFRPFIYRLANDIGVSGSVKNMGDAGVEVILEGSEGEIQKFLKRLPRESPPLSEIQSVDVSYSESLGLEGFLILKSADGGEGSRTIPPDTTLCERCLEDIRNPQSRYYNYWATSCVD